MEQCKHTTKADPQEILCQAENRMCVALLSTYMQTSCTLSCTAIPIPLRENVKALCIYQETVRMQTNTTTSFGCGGTHDEMDVDNDVACQSD